MPVTSRHQQGPRLPELLAPAGSPEAFRAAVAAGADAVYLSGKRFGARKYAANFSDQEIADAVDYAHAHGIRVYVTVNTLIHDRELAGAMDYLIRLYETGVDAVLVQDTGLAALAREYVPGLAIHASTQMTIHNADGVREAHDLGFSRVVLARELSLDEVARIAEETQDTGTGLEVFVHGALCYSYSGQCLLSSVIGGRSGNRGMCAQPCRKPYTLVQGEPDAYGRPARLSPVPLKERYLLSPKDLCTYRHLPELVGSPVVSLKIEGRMRSPEYVAIVVSTYRRALDAIAAGTWTASDEAFRDLLLAFNRGFTAGYLSGDRYGDLMGRDAPDNRGLMIGRVERYDPKTSSVSVRQVIPVIPVMGDGLLIAHPDQPEDDRGFALNTLPVKTRSGFTLAVPGPVQAGARVCITSSLDLGRKAHRIIAKPSPDLLRPLQTDLDVSIDPDGSIRLDGRVIRPDGTVIPVSFHYDRRMEPARTHPLTRDMLEEQFRKTGGTPFAVRTFTLTYGGHRFAPVAFLNTLRRAFFRHAGDVVGAASRPPADMVKQARERLRTRPLPSPGTVPAGTTDRAGHLRVSVYTDTPEGVRKAAAAGAATICYEPLLPGDRYLCADGAPDASPRSRVLAAIDVCRDAGALLVWKFPRIVHDTRLDALIPDIRFLHSRGLTTCMSENPGISRAIRRAVPAMTLYGSTGLNMFNHASVRHAAQYTLLMLSPELSGDEISLLTALAAADARPPSFALIVQGSSEAMVTEDCIRRMVLNCRRPGAVRGEITRSGFLGLQDETGRVFPVRTDSGCRTSVANASELCLIDLLPRVRDAGITDLVIDARHRPAEYTGRMVRLYLDAVRAACDMEGSARDTRLRQLKEQVRGIALGGITAGHFLRGLKE